MNEAESLTFSLPPALARRAAQGELGHAYLLSGAQEPQLEEAARTLAAAYLCEADGDRPCGACRHCRKVARDIHPDLQWVEKPEDKSQLIVEQIRALRSDAYIRPNEAGRKVYVIRNAQQMNDEAQNAFLKVLEEGPAYAAFLLLSTNALAMLPTVRSRCEAVRVDAAGQADEDLVRRGGELAGLLLGEDRWRLISWCVGYDKARREEVLPLWEQARQALLTYRKAGNTAKAVRLARGLEDIIAAGSGNGNIGILWGRLWSLS